MTRAADVLNNEHAADREFPRYPTAGSDLIFALRRRARGGRLIATFLYRCGTISPVGKDGGPCPIGHVTSDNVRREVEDQSSCGMIFPPPVQRNWLGPVGELADGVGDPALDGRAVVIRPGRRAHRRASHSVPNLLIYIRNPR